MDRRSFCLAITLLLVLLSGVCAADTVSLTGNLDSPTSYFTYNFTLGSASTVTLKTFGFGGGVNASGNVIAEGGFDPLVALFVGTGPAATIIDGTSDVLSNYAPFPGCVPVTIGGTSACGDVFLSFNLGPGSYMAVLSDAAYIPVALVSFSPTLGDGFVDFTGGEFKTCNGFDANGDPVCSLRDPHWAMDITGLPTAPTGVPEPGTLVLVSSGLAAAWLRRRGVR